MSTGFPLRGQYAFVSTSAYRLSTASAVEDVPSVDAPERAPPDPALAPSFEAIYEAHFDLAWRTARRLGVPESAVDDVVQDAFLVLHRRLAEYDGRASLKRWLLGILVKVVADHRRRFRRKEGACVPHESDSASDVAIASPAPSPGEDAERSETVLLLDQLLRQLDKDKREVLVLAELEEMSVPEIAEILGQNVNTIYARLRAARREFDVAHQRHRALVRGENARASRRTP